MQGKAVGDNLQPPVVDPIVRQEVQVPDHHVGSHPDSCLSADPRSRALERETHPPKNPRGCTSRPVVATSVLWTATPACRQGEGKVKTVARLECDVRGSEIGLRVRDSKPSDGESRGHSDPMDVDVVNSLSSGKKKVIDFA